MPKNDRDSIVREQVDRLGRPSIEMLDREITRCERKESYRRLILGGLITLVTLAAVIVLVTNLWVAVLRIDGSSMKPLLEVDEVVLAVIDNAPNKNDIIAFTHNDKIYIKRVIAASGDLIRIDKNGVVSVNGTVLEEPYAKELALGNCDIEFPFTVPSGTVFVMGDNRSVSVDSRNSQFGTVNREQILGKVVFRVWPLSGLGSVS